ncbi:MAG: hypothetical protein V1769_06060 [Thermoplasmatota archaeon]
MKKTLSSKTVTICVLLFIISTLLPMQLVLSEENEHPLTDHIRTLLDNKTTIQTLTDIDPLVDVHVTVTIKEIRALDEIDKNSNPDFYVKVFINEDEYTSDVWKNEQYISELQWSCTCNVPDDVEDANIVIQLWDHNIGRDILCDIAANDNGNADRNDLTVLYSIKTGHWLGDDMTYIPHSWSMDLSGYGRGNGCDDNSIYIKDNDCEISFDITQNDYDSDGIPYWTETEIYHTDPTVDDRGRDDDNDGIPIEWEHRWGHIFDWQYDEENDEWYPTHAWFYHPFIWDDHTTFDPDNDGLNNIAEHLTSQWGSDPFRKDLFVELDQMNAGPNGEQASILPEGSKDLIRDSFSRQNVVFHLDDGTWEGETGSEIIPFDDNGENSTWEEINEMYNEYFLHNDEHNWRKGVFHHGLVIYNAEWACGFCFRPDAFQISTLGMEKKVRSPVCGSRDVVYASAYMHELGHSLGLMFLGGHTEEAYYPWQPLWWKFRPYKSIMNYGYMYGFIHDLVDYSDGSRGKNDFDDWSNLDLLYFQS